MVRVLVVGKGAPDRGGIAAYLADLLASSITQEHDLEFLNLTRPGPPHAGRLDFGNVKATLLDALALWRRSEGRDVVHLHTALAPGVTALRAGLLSSVARLRGARVLLHAHGGLVQTWTTTPRRRFLLRLALRPAASVAVVASSVATVLRSVVEEPRLVLVPNGVDLARFGSGERVRDRNSTPRLLYVGLLTPRKGIPDLVAASKILRDRDVAHELVLVGGTPDEGPEVEEMVLAGIEQAKLLGSKERTEMPAVYADADVFCLPSWWEAMPLTVLEAMAAGLPVVATDVGDIAVLVQNGVTGTVVQPREPEGLADALEAFLVDRELRTRQGRAGRARAESTYDWKDSIERVEHLYRQIAGIR